MKIIDTQINFPPYVPILSKYYYNAQVTEYDTELPKYLLMSRNS